MAGCVLKVFEGEISSVTSSAECIFPDATCMGGVMNEVRKRLKNKSLSAMTETQGASMHSFTQTPCRIADGEAMS